MTKHRNKDPNGNGILNTSLKETIETDSTDEPAIKNKITLLGGVSVIVGSMVGSGIFISPLGVLVNAGSIGMSLIVWFLSGLVAICGSLSYAELGTMIPLSGAEYPYILRAFGPLPAFLFVWTSSLILKPSAVAILGIVFGEYVIQPFFPGCQVPTLAVKLSGICCITLVTFINVQSIKVAEKTQIIFTAGKLIPLIIVIVAGLCALAWGYTDNLQNAFKGEFMIGSMGMSFYQGLWAYDGWNQLNYITEELENPYINLPRSIMIGIPLVTGIYILTNISYYAALTMAEMVASRAVAVTFGVKMLGVMAWIIPIGVATSTFGGCNGYTITGPRIIYSAARNGHTPKLLSMSHIKTRSPVPAILFNSFVAIVLVLPSNFDSLLSYFSVSMWIFHGASACALLYLRYKEPNLERPYRVPIALPVIVVLFAIFLVTFPIIMNPAMEYLYAGLFILSGILFYVPFLHYKIKVKCFGEFSTF